MFQYNLVSNLVLILFFDHVLDLIRNFHVLCVIDNLSPSLLPDEVALELLLDFVDEHGLSIEGALVGTNFSSSFQAHAVVRLLVDLETHVDCALENEKHFSDLVIDVKQYGSFFLPSGFKIKQNLCHEVPIELVILHGTYSTGLPRISILLQFHLGDAKV